MIKIAIVDDEQEILGMIERYLQRTGDYVVHTFSNPLDALEKLDNSFDVALLDIMMPQMNGLDLLAKIEKKALGCKVIMMTAYSTLDKVLRAHQEGATHYIMKPFSSLKDLEAKIKEIL
ncbi:MAG: response regulator [Campylobacteraceae bacterium]|nr:response regulator [Campylobacteraceae bacterium]